MDYHQPVLVEEVLKTLNVTAGNIYIDGTVGNGGHTLEILKLGGKVYGLDLDPSNLEITTQRIKQTPYYPNFTPVNTSFIDLPKIDHIDGILLDLGLSSGQQKASGRGFSFNDSESLDMRLNPLSEDETAESLINTADYDTLYEIFTKYAQEQYAKPLIIRIISERQKSPIKSGQRLANIIRDYYELKKIRTKIDPSTKIFMALRIAINQEFTNLKSFLDSSLKLNRGCTIAIITFHSGEDRIVKQFIKSNFPKSPKAILPTHEEIKRNPLSRSAVLRSYRID